MKGSEWLVRNLELYGKPPASELGLKVADIIGWAFGGIYHVSQVWNNRWHDPHCIIVKVRQSLSTYDTSELMRLVTLCGDAEIRLEIIPSGAVVDQDTEIFRDVGDEEFPDIPVLKLMFHQRSHTKLDTLGEGIPPFDEMVKRARLSAVEGT